MDSMPLPAVLLAGGKARDALTEAGGVCHKALLPVAGRPMVTHVAAALAACEAIGKIYLAGPPEVAAVLPDLAHLGDAETFMGNVMAGVAACTGAPYCLFITCDIPFVTPPMLADFVTQATRRAVDLVYPILALARCEERFPGMRRTSLRVREGCFTGGNAMVVRPAFLARNVPLLESTFAARKQPLRLAGMVGWDLVFRALLSPVLPGLLPLSLLEERVGRLVGGRVAALEIPYPEIGADIDKPEDLAGIG
ncbi:MAG: NTP transferase domain-containing protein [Armatimonadetes bacterium]|jgi:GTP:adenosylcobinamide-phosphate guanylyltransferase|nr:NTP transferase domain-containing protein [Armatimonadota bacterium]